MKLNQYHRTMLKEFVQVCKKANTDLAIMPDGSMFTMPSGDNISLASLHKFFPPAGAPPNPCYIHVDDFSKALNTTNPDELKLMRTKKGGQVLRFFYNHDKGKVDVHLNDADEATNGFDLLDRLAKELTNRMRLTDSNDIDTFFNIIKLMKRKALFNGFIELYKNCISEHRSDEADTLLYFIDCEYISADDYVAVSPDPLSIMTMRVANIKELVLGWDDGRPLKAIIETTPDDAPNFTFMFAPVQIDEIKDRKLILKKAVDEWYGNR